jgi:hypothetical protein
MEGGFRRAKPVEGPEPLLADINEPSPVKVAQVAGHARLRHLEDRHDVANTKLSGLQEVKEPEPRTVGERAKHPLDLCR